MSDDLAELIDLCEIRCRRHHKEFLTTCRLGIIDAPGDGLYVAAVH